MARISPVWGLVMMAAPFLKFLLPKVQSELPWNLWGLHILILLPLLYLPPLGLFFHPQPFFEEQFLVFLWQVQGVRQKENIWSVRQGALQEVLPHQELSPWRIYQNKVQTPLLFRKQFHHMEFD